MATTDRLLALLSLLQARRDWPGAFLSERLAVSARTVRRDIERLRELGYSIAAVKGPDGGYRLDAGAQLPPLLFDDEQAVALAVALRMAASSGADVEEGAARALGTLRQVLPSRLRHRVESIDVAVAPVASARVDPATLLAVGDAVRARVVLRFDYGSSDHGGRPTSPRRVEPHAVVARDARWYLVAWDLDREGWRIYRLDRMTPRVPTGPRFALRRIPGDDAAAYVSARFKGSDEADAWPCIGRVVLRAPASAVAPFVRDGVVEDLGEDRCRISDGAWSWIALAAAFGRFDAAIETAEPAALAEAFDRLGRRFADVRSR